MFFSIGAIKLLAWNWLDALAVTLMSTWPGFAVIPTEGFSNLSQSPINSSMRDSPIPAVWMIREIVVLFNL